jgi:ATP-dependent RNA helicase RhlE
MSFENLGLSPYISKAISKLGFIKPFEIQKDTIPPILKGENYNCIT